MTVDHNREFTEERKITVPLLADTGNAVAASYGLVFEMPGDLRALYAKFGIELPAFNGDESWTLPMPARFVIDGAGKIRSVATDPDYTVRPEPEEVLELLGAL
jgi:peroxiredoxin